MRSPALPAARPVRRQRGAALVIALLMLMILTILALSGINTATTELAMAGNEQYRRNAAQAATAGIEEAISGLGAVPTAPGAAPTVVAPTLLPESTSERYATATRFIGDENGLPQSSADKFVGLHFQIDSTGTSLRNASDDQVQGVMVVAASGSSGGNSSFTQLGGGLE
jgi:type IV pilus assembly protein PilX